MASVCLNSYIQMSYARHRHINLAIIASHFLVPMICIGLLFDKTGYFATGGLALLIIIHAICLLTLDIRQKASERARLFSLRRLKVKEKEAKRVTAEYKKKMVMDALIKVQEADKGGDKLLDNKL